MKKGPPASHKTPPPRAMVGPGCATAGFFVWLGSIGLGSVMLSKGTIPEWGMFVVLSWPFMVGIPLVFAEAMLQRRHGRAEGKGDGLR